MAGQYIDEGHSGREIKRPAYQRMMSEKDKWDVLVVLKMDRIHRNSQNFTNMMNDLKAWNKEFNSMQESFDTTTAIGRFVMDIIQRIAQLESEQIGERVKVGMTQKAKKHKGMLGFGEPYGYRFSNGTLEVIEPEAEVVREIYIRYSRLESISSIVDSLNSAGIKPKKGGMWKKGTVSKILHSPLYNGHLKWTDIFWDKHHREIIDDTLFLEVSRILRLKSGAFRTINDNEGGRA